MDSPGQGCLLTNAAIEFGAAASVASGGVRSGFEVLTAAIRRVVSAEVPGPTADRAVAHLLMLYQGLLVLVRSGQDTSSCSAVIRTAFAQLRDSHA